MQLHRHSKVPDFVTRAFGQAANLLIARRPRFAIIGTGRCGTGYVAESLTSVGFRFGHEDYYTPSGPKLRNRHRHFRAIGDVSWLAVPFLPDPDVQAAHVVRHPVDVIGSFYRIGFFDSQWYERHRRFVDFARRHFEFSEDPLHSSLRWYLEWNARCEGITALRWRVEDFEVERAAIVNWLGAPAVTAPFDVSRRTNSRDRLAEIDEEGVRRRIESFEEYEKLCIMAARYGYSI